MGEKSGRIKLSFSESFYSNLSVPIKKELLS